MPSQESNNKKTTDGLVVVGLKYKIIVPFFVLIALLIIALFSLTTENGQSLFVLLLVAIIALLAVVGMGLLLARQIDRRINEIIEAAEKVALGDLTVRLADNHHDELGRLAQVFNQMVANLDHLYQTRDRLSRTMSPAVRQSLIEKGLDFRGIEQKVSILFIDIRDFTRITERHNTEQLVFFLNDYYTTIASQVHIGGGIIGKYGGDSILAFFGAPEPEPPSKSSTSALLTALALQESIAEMSDRWMILGLPPIKAGIGISIGEAVAGPIGSEQQFEYTVIGDAVNLASRLQDLTRNIAGYSIILSKEVHDSLEERVRKQIKVLSQTRYERLRDEQKAKSPILFVDFGEVLVKGKKGPVHVYGIPD